MMRDKRSRSIEPVAARRQVLKILGSGVAAGLVPLGCAPESGGETPRIPVESVTAGGRVRVLDGENPVEVRRGADGTVAARSLWCTHFGCEVAWSEDQGAYLCPCHEGIYDADGRPISGPPVRALATVPVSVRDGEILIGVPSTGGAG